MRPGHRTARAAGITGRQVTEDSRRKRGGRHPATIIGVRTLGATRARTAQKQNRRVKRLLAGIDDEHAAGATRTVIEEALT